MSPLELSKLGPGAQAQLKQAGWLGKRGRYTVAPRAKRTVDGVVFDSKLEAQVYQLLRGQLPPDKLQRQVKFELAPQFTDGDGKKRQAIRYVADFVVTLADGDHVLDTKGHVTSEFKLKEKLFAARYPRPIRQIRTAAEAQAFLRGRGGW